MLCSVSKQLLSLVSAAHATGKSAALAKLTKQLQEVAAEQPKQTTEAPQQDAARIQRRAGYKHHS